jgi:hypothetical protein
MKELLDIFYLNIPNFAAAFFGWLAFSVIVLRIDKDKFDSEGKAWPIGAYASKTWDNWLASFVMIPVLVWAGYKQLELGVLFDHGVRWSDAYYLLSGFATELIIIAYTKWKNK